MAAYSRDMPSLFIIRFSASFGAMIPITASQVPEISLKQPDGVIGYDAPSPGKILFFHPVDAANNKSPGYAVQVFKRRLVREHYAPKFFCVYPAAPEDPGKSLVQSGLELVVFFKERMINLVAVDSKAPIVPAPSELSSFPPVGPVTPSLTVLFSPNA